jgi:hypothetical protein
MADKPADAPPPAPKKDEAPPPPFRPDHDLIGHEKRGGDRHGSDVERRWKRQGWSCTELKIRPASGDYMAAAPPGLGLPEPSGVRVSGATRGQRQHEIAGHEEGAGKGVRLLLNGLIASLGLDVHDEMPELVRGVEAGSNVVLAGPEHDDGTSLDDFREGVHGGHDRRRPRDDGAVQLEQADHAGYRSGGHAPLGADRFGDRPDLPARGGL